MDDTYRKAHTRLPRRTSKTDEPDPMPIDIVIVQGGFLCTREVRAFRWLPELFANLRAELQDMGKDLRIRVKIVVFGDVYTEANAYRESGFFREEEAVEGIAEFAEREKIEELFKIGPKSSLEALYRTLEETHFADIKENWGLRVVVLMTDQPAYRRVAPLCGDPEYPKDTPDYLAGIKTLWDGMEPFTKRLIILAPDVWPWNTMQDWERTSFLPAAPDASIPTDAMMIQDVCRSILVGY